MNGRKRVDRGFRAAEIEEARAGWRLGLLAPWRITAALDLGGHHGPDVDTACGAREPEVDEWEAGTRYPTFEQLLLLAELTGRSPAWFVRLGEPIEARRTSLWDHMTAAQRRQWKDPVEPGGSDPDDPHPGTLF
jgi:hypothetical protein